MKVRLRGIWRGGAWVTINGVTRGAVFRDDGDTERWDYAVIESDGVAEYGPLSFRLRREAVAELVRWLMAADVNTRNR